MRGIANPLPLIGILLIASGCVSVSLPTKTEIQRARVKFRAPNAPFETFQADKADQAWRNGRTGNSISYFSNCNDASDPSLDAIRRDMLSGIADVSVVSHQSLQYNGREALRSVVAGQVDGVQAKMDVLVFKKNTCIYGLTYVGLAKRFADDHSIFESFIQGFEAP